MRLPFKKTGYTKTKVELRIRPSTAAEKVLDLLKKVQQQERAEKF